jgi:anti-sigma-K factor RskA
MNTTKETGRDEIELLLPWHAAGTLSPREAQRVEAALASDAELARRYDLVREELGETIHLNETLGAPSARAFARLSAAIEAETPAKRQASFDVAAWVSGLLSQFSPRTLAWSATAAALAIVVQVGIIAGLYVKERAGSATYATASKGDAAAPAAGAFVLVRFNPAVSAADITRFLDANKATIAEGPKAGMYRLRVAPAKLPQDELAKIVARLAQEPAVVSLVLPSE